MSHIHSFPPVSHAKAHTLILGSIPGIVSLETSQYYAHPQNKFWPILCPIIGTTTGSPYEKRLAALTQHGIALWDVLASCHRKGSLDTAIKNEKPNDFESFFKAHEHIATIILNGKKAESAFKKHILKKLDRSFILHTLPSTSPANARLTYAQKKEIWEDTLRPLLRH